MCTVFEMMRRFDRLREQLPNIAADTMRETKTEFLDWQKEQLFAGKKKTGGSITPPYHPVTILHKKLKGQPYDRVTLKDTGVFYESLFLVINRDSMTYSVVSSDIKSNKLLAQYGANVLGLGGVFKLGYLNDIRPVYIGKIRKILRL